MSEVEKHTINWTAIALAAIAAISSVTTAVMVKTNNTTLEKVHEATNSTASALAEIAKQKDAEITRLRNEILRLSRRKL